MKRWIPVAAVLFLAACGGSHSETLVIRLVDQFPSANIEGSAVSTAPEAPRTEWRFVVGDLGWQEGPGVQGLTVRDGMLAGRTTSDMPVIHVERTSGLEDFDVLHEIVVQMSASEGSNLRIGFSAAEEVDLDGVLGRARRLGWTLSTPIVSGDEIRTYRINPTSAAFQTSFSSSSIRHVVLSPTDAEGAEFAIASVRLVFRREYLASIPAGVSWQGLDNVFRETIVTRAPQRAEFEMALPERPRLELALGTVEDGPVTFRVGISAGGQLERTLLLERTITTANRWEDVYRDLSEYAGRDVTLFLALDGAPGAIGFWGTPAIRNRGVLASPDAPRGVILVVFDTLRRDHLDVYGYERETAPTLTRLARSGAIFQDAIAQGTWTKVSVPSMLTSTYPTSNGISDFADRLPASAPTLAEAFREAGYATWHSSSVPFAGRLSNLHQGVEVLHERASMHLPDGQSSSKTARAVVDRLLPWLETHQDVPFFVFLHALDPHSDYEPYRPYDVLWAEKDGKSKHEERVETVRPYIQSDFMRNMGLPTREELVEAGVDPEAFVQHERDWYDGSIRAADVELARVVEKLRELEILDETLIVFTSDHGEEFLDHGGSFHEENVYGELINVPLVFRWPGVVPAGSVVHETVELLDVAPTILELSGIPIPERMQGDSLVPLLSGSDDGHRWRNRPAVSKWTKRKDQLGTDIVDARSIILDGWKLVHNVDRPAGVPEYELYDHRDDPLDQNDVADEHPEVVQRLAEQLDGWHAWALENKLPSDDQAAEGMSSEELERLRSLGYIQ